MTPSVGPPIAVLDYGIGNIRSAERALSAAGASARLVTSAQEAEGAGGVVLPGVGAFGPSADALRDRGLDRVALDAIGAGIPFLGICVGFQLLYDSSEESPTTQGLGVFPGVVRRLGAAVKVPQMQWNVLDERRPSALLRGVGAAPWVYFVHSYVPEVGEETIATCEYGARLSAAAERGDVWATQFHPEKSGAVGLAILANFVALCSRRSGGSSGSSLSRDTR